VAWWGVVVESFIKEGGRCTILCTAALCKDLEPAKAT
jgi:hypothetical protein